MSKQRYEFHRETFAADELIELPERAEAVNIDPAPVNGRVTISYLVPLVSSR